MQYYKNLTRVLFAFLGLVVLWSTTSSAFAPFQETENTITTPAMLMVTRIEIDKRKKEQWSDAWTTIRDAALEGRYNHPTFMAMHKNIRWMVTPMNSYGDIDRIFAERKRLNTEIGDTFTSAISMFEDAELSTHTFIAHHDPALSYHHAGMEESHEMNIDTVYFKSGQNDEMRAILADYKAINTDVDRMDGYDVYWNTVGSNGMSLTFISSGDSLADFARKGIRKDKDLKNNKSLKSLIKRFDKIVVRADNEKADREMELSIMPEDTK